MYVPLRRLRLPFPLDEWVSDRGGDCGGGGGGRGGNCVGGI